MNTEEQLVSVVIPTFNRAGMVGRAIQSVLKQSYGHIELIVVDDGSNDNTHLVVTSFNDDRVNYIRLRSNMGGAFARNVGIDIASGEFIAFLDSDDEWLPLKLEKQVNFFKNCTVNVGAVYCLYYVRNDSLREFSIEIKSGDLFLEFLRGWCPSITSAIMFRSEVFIKAGKFDENFVSFQDYDLWIRISKFYKIFAIEEHLVIVNDHMESRVGVDQQIRLKGLNQFLHKWKTTIAEEVGYNYVESIRKNHLKRVYSKLLINNLKLNNRKSSFYLLIKSIKLGNVRPNFLFTVFLLLIGGAKLLNLSKRIKGIIIKDTVVVSNDL